MPSDRERIMKRLFAALAMLAAVTLSAPGFAEMEIVADDQMLDVEFGQ